MSANLSHPAVISIHPFSYQSVKLSFSAKCQIGDDASVVSLHSFSLSFFFLFSLFLLLSLIQILRDTTSHFISSHSSDSFTASSSRTIISSTIQVISLSQSIFVFEYTKLPRYTVRKDSSLNRHPFFHLDVLRRFLVLSLLALCNLPTPLFNQHDHRTSGVRTVP